MNEFTKRRWYDEDATLSFAVGLLEKADKAVQTECAEIIIQKAHDFNIYMPENKLEDSFNYILKRWYDEDKVISDSFEYLKMMSFDLQKEISLELIEKLG